MPHSSSFFTLLTWLLLLERTVTMAEAENCGGGPNQGQQTPGFLWHNIQIFLLPVNKYTTSLCDDLVHI
jgi:hypothetical protein